MQRSLKPVFNALQGLRVALQGAAHHGIQLQAQAAPVFAQAPALPLPERAELVVVVGTQAGLTVTNQVDLSHAPGLCSVGVARQVASGTITGGRC